MIKRTPQEIANFFQCYVAQDKDGDWYIYEKAPVADLSEAIWRDGGRSAVTPHEAFMDVPKNHDWTKLYEPQGKEGKTEGDFPNSTEQAESDNKPAPYYEKQADSDNKASHQSQVHVHSEYDVIYGGYPEQLSIKVTEMMHEGWKPVGGIVCLPPAHREDSETFYQAMVRGLE